LKISTRLLALMLIAAGNALAGTMTYVGPVAPALKVELVIPSSSFVEEASQGKFLLDSVGIEAYCIEPDQTSVFPNPYTAVVLSTSDPKYKLANSLYTQFYGANRLTPAGTAAIQSVLWEIWTDTSALDLATGFFRFGAATDPLVSSLAKQMLSATIANNYAPQWVFTQYLSPFSQDLLSATPLSSPGVLGLLGIGAIAFLGKRKPVSSKSAK
jgi:hypothetical protein